MDRRLFVKTALSTAAISQGTLPASAFPASASPDQVFYDERFAGARALAAQQAGGRAPTPTMGDVTALWTEGLNRRSRAAPLALSGVTTESFYFCLKTLMQPHAALETTVRRVSKDLYAWSIQTTLTNKKTG